MSFHYSLQAIYCISAVSFGNMLASAEDTQTENTSPTYGKEWVLFPDDLGGLHFANLSFVTSPAKTVQRNVYFHLYTQNNQAEHEELLIDSESKTEFFDQKNPIKFITHGWMSDGESTTVIDIKDAYLKRENLNAIVVDWHEIADEMVYVVAATSTRYVGYKVSQMAGSLVDRYNVSEDQIHLIGHSLGAHVMGFAGKELQKNNFTAARITGSSLLIVGINKIVLCPFKDSLKVRSSGLDPARPLFEFPPTGGLSSSDAQFVDIVHTCGGVLGYRSSYGHADFYPNGGTAPQPGCDGLAQLVDACSHARAHQYFAESIDPAARFVSRSCASYEDFRAADCPGDTALMGDPADSSARGDYYLRTNAEAKYARGDDADVGEEGEGQ